MKTVGSGSADLSSPEPRIKRMRTTVNAEKPSDCVGVAKSQSLPGNSVAGKHSDKVLTHPLSTYSQSYKPSDPTITTPLILQSQPF